MRITGTNRLVDSFAEMNDESDSLAPRTVTSTTLLNGLRDPANRTVWDGYVGRYRPLVVRTAKRFGLSSEDAEDVAQIALTEFAEAFRRGSYDRARGRLRSWLFGIVRNQVRNWVRRRATPSGDRGAAGAPDVISSREPEAPDELDRIWDEEWRDSILAHCLSEVRQEVEPATFEAFRRFAIDGRPAEEVARDLGMSPNAVFGAKRRILRRLRELRPFMEEIW